VNRTVTASPTNIPVARVHRHADDRGPFWVAVCPCTWASREYDGPDGGVTAEYAKALHDMAHTDELEAAS
jgi:hypothetical protein